MADQKDLIYKLLLIGDGNVGKSTFVKRHRTGEFEKQYIPTIGVEVHPLKFHTNYGPVTFKVWDTAGQEKFGGLRDAYYINGDCAILMYDVTNRMTFSSLYKWYSDIKRVCADIPIVIVGNKYDVETKPTKDSEFKPDGKEFEHFKISALTNHNFEKPFLALAKKLVDDTNLIFVAAPALYPPDVPFDDQGREQGTKVINDAANVPLPDDDD